MSSTKIVTPARARTLDAAVALIAKRGGADVTMAEIAAAAGISRQALYLQFADRSALLLSLVDYVDRRRGLDAAIQRVMRAPDGPGAIREMVALQARMNPSIWTIARAFDAVRRRDKAAQRSWENRHARRYRGARSVVDRLVRERALKPGLDPAAAADLMWSLLSLRTWEDLVLERGWSPEQYQERVTALVFDALLGRKTRVSSRQ